MNPETTQLLERLEHGLTVWRKWAIGPDEPEELEALLWSEQALERLKDLVGSAERVRPVPPPKPPACPRVTS